MADLTIALPEEIGNPNLFTGRKQELAFYLDWAHGTKNLLSKSQALLSRRKKGKTALMQRLFNILYSNNDPRVIPFFSGSLNSRSARLILDSNFTARF